MCVYFFVSRSHAEGWKHTRFLVVDMRMNTCVCVGVRSKGHCMLQHELVDVCTCVCMCACLYLCYHGEVSEHPPFYTC